MTYIRIHTYKLTRMVYIQQDIHKFPWMLVTFRYSFTSMIMPIAASVKVQLLVMEIHVSTFDE